MQRRIASRLAGSRSAFGLITALVGVVALCAVVPTVQAQVAHPFRTMEAYGADALAPNADARSTGAAHAGASAYGAERHLRLARAFAEPQAEGRPSDATPAAGLLSTAARYLGVRYRWSGTSPVTGFDCSGFVQYVFAKHAARLPRTSRAMAQVGEPLPAHWDALQPGDIVLFAARGKRVTHVAIYAGSRRIIHATSGSGRVRYDDIDSGRGRWFTRRLVAARRVPLDDPALLRDLLAASPREANVGG